MSIAILKITIDNDPQTFEPVSRAAYIYISNNGSAFMHTVSPLPLTGDIQTILNADEPALFTSAQTGGILPTAREKAEAERLIWLTANPNAKLIFSATPAALEASIVETVDILFSGKPALDRTKMKRLLMGLSLVAREAVLED
jgi:hypothetical protein